MIDKYQTYGCLLDKMQLERKWKDMKKIKCLLFVFCVCLLSACQSNDNVSKVNEQQSVSVPNETISSDGKILIAYFTWADNTHVDDP